MIVKASEILINKVMNNCSDFKLYKESLIKLHTLLEVITVVDRDLVKGISVMHVDLKIHLFYA